MQTILDELKLKAKVVGIEDNDVILRYFLQLNPGGTVKKIENRVNEIALGMHSKSIPTIKLIPEKGLVVLEMLKKEMDIIHFHALTYLPAEYHLPVMLGRDYQGKDLTIDVAKLPHLLVAGTTGSGKSVLLHSIICSLLIQKQSKVELVLIDPKNVEFAPYQKVKQLRYPIVNYPDDASKVLSDLTSEMDYRFKIMKRAKVNYIHEYNLKKKNKMSYIVVIIDEFADFMQISKKKFQNDLARLAQKSRACGIHIIIATQRPSADVITGIIKANCPSVIAFQVSSAVNSRVILDENGAEKLLGNGDGIIRAPGYINHRFKGAYLSMDEIYTITKDNKKSFWKKCTDLVKNA